MKTFMNFHILCRSGVPWS